MDGKLMYAFRGWIAFVAFMDLGTAVRSYIEKRSFLHETGDFSEPKEFDEGAYTSSRILGLYSVLKAIALIHCTLFIHYRTAVSMGICSIVLTIFLYLSETVYFRSSTFNFYVTFPCTLNLVTLGGLIYLPQRLKLWDTPMEMDDENNQLLKQACSMKRRRNQRKAPHHT